MYEEIYIYNNNTVLGIAKIYENMIQVIDYRIYFGISEWKLVKDR